MILLNEPITFVRGITALGKHIGIRHKRMDFCVVRSEKPASCASVFTKNTVKAAPLLVSMDHLKKTKGKAQALFVVSGVANACTGQQGMRDAARMCALLGEELGIEKEMVAVNSTGVIGRLLPMELIENSMKGTAAELGNTPEHGLNAAQAIMTTDTVMKIAAIEVDGVRFAGMAKGSGMIHPNMATMLCFLFTDAVITSPDLQSALNRSIESSFNMMSVDNCTSTNDTVAVFANGMSGKSLSKQAFQQALDALGLTLCKKIVADGEGATKMFETTVKHAKTSEDARMMVKAVITSDLIKTAVYGNDPNWGRIAQAIGQTGIAFDFNKTDIFFDHLQLVKDGMHTDFDPGQAKRIMQQKQFTIIIDLKQGTATATGWGCDLTEGYIKENALYTT